MLKEQRRKEELDAAKEKQKQDERIRRTKAAMDENSRQMEQKRKQAEQEKDQGLVLREKFRSDVEVYKKSVEEERYLSTSTLHYPSIRIIMYDFCVFFVNHSSLCRFCVI